jgi:hypothetical protein
MELAMNYFLSFLCFAMAVAGGLAMPLFVPDFKAAILLSMLWGAAWGILLWDISSLMLKE